MITYFLQILSLILYLSYPIMLFANTSQEASEQYCNVHKEKLLKDTVKITYGLRLYIDILREDEEELFPNANTIVYGGCSFDEEQDQKEEQEIFYCPKCREERLKYINGEGRWKHISNKELGFEAYFPGFPQYTFKNDVGKKEYTYVLNGARGKYTIEGIIYNKSIPSSSKVSNIPHSNLATISQDGVIGYEEILESTSQTTQSRIFYVGKHVYKILIEKPHMYAHSLEDIEWSGQTDKEIEKFLTSIKFIKD